MAKTLAKTLATTIEKTKNQQLWYHLTITIIFIYIFYNLLTMKTANFIYGFWHTYIMNKYCFILYLILSLFILWLDSYTGVLLLVLAVGTFKSALRELFTPELFSGDSSDIIDPRYNPQPTAILVAPINDSSNSRDSSDSSNSSNIKPTTIPNTTIPAPATTTIPKILIPISNGVEAIPTKILDGRVAADLPVPTLTPLQDTLSVDKIQAQALGKDERFKVDEVAVREILQQIKAQVDFDPYKTQLDKDVIYEIYNKYFDNDIFKKLQNNNSDSASYIAAGNFNYVPTVAKVDYDLITYQNLSNNTGFGINPLTDGIANKTKVNRG